MKNKSVRARAIKPIVAHSRILRAGCFTGVDMRSAEGKAIREFEAQLVDHLGGKDHVTWPQQVLIKRAAVLALRLYSFDMKFQDEGLSSYDAKVYNATLNSLRLLLRELGLKKVVGRKGKSLTQHLDEKYAAKPVNGSPAPSSPDDAAATERASDVGEVFTVPASLVGRQQEGDQAA